MAEVARRPDHHLLHPATGLDVSGDAELPHYLLMRCVSELKEGKGRSSLASDLTGCWSTLLHSAEGRTAQKSLQASAVGTRYLGLLRELVDESQDASHPKVRAVTDAVVDAWRAGEKTLVFCFRTHTARRLRDLFEEATRRELDARAAACLGSPGALDNLRARLTGRDRDLMPVTLDRVLWSCWWARPKECGFGPDDLRLTDADLHDLAELGARFDVDLAADRVDRVFLHRATERVLARRLVGGSVVGSAVRAVLDRMTDLGWVERPLGSGVEGDSELGEHGGDHLDERGAHAHFVEAPPRGEVRDLVARRLHARRAGQVSLYDTYYEGPNLWLGTEPVKVAGDPGTAAGRRVAGLHPLLFELSLRDGAFHAQERLSVMKAVRRAILKTSVIVRLLPERSDREDARWGELLVDAFYRAPAGRNESMADRIGVFLEDLVSASGTTTEGMRGGMLSAARNTQTVALVDGGTAQEQRERVFAGFNTPLLPEVLVCTSVGQEGIDLHRQCRHAVHYDLAWNPAVIEQRTGRVDRIGSKAFRERAEHVGPEGPFLEAERVNEFETPSVENL